MADFEIAVPINVSGGSSGSSGGKDSGATKEIKKLNSNTLKLNKTMILNIDILEMLSSIAGDLFKVIQPLFKILSLLLLVIFLPLMPLMNLLIKGLAKLVKLFTGGYGNIGEMIGKAILGIILGAIALVLIAVGGSVVAIVALLIGTISLLWEPIWTGITWLGEQIANLAIWIWDWVVQGFMALGELSVKLWEVIKSLFKGTINVLTTVWEFFKTLFKGTINAVGDVWGWIKSLFRGTIDVVGMVWGFIRSLFGGGSGPEGRASGGNVLTGQSYVVGENGPEMFSPSGSGTITPNNKMGGGVTVNINNASVRNDGDIRSLANEVSRVLQRQMSGRISSG